MTTQGILVVHPGWHEGDAAVLDRATYQRYQDELQEGTRVLFYMKDPVDALVGEAQVTGNPVQAEIEPEAPVSDPVSPRAEEPVRRMNDPQPSRIDQRTYHLPYLMLHSIDNISQIPLGTIRARIGSEFGVFDDEWIPLTEEQYDALVGEWEHNAS